MEKEVYTQSLCFINEAVELYYVEGLTQVEIAKKLNISKPTVSRLLKQASHYGIVQFKVERHFLDCMKLQRELQERYPIEHIYVVPMLEDQNEDELKQSIAIEGARYLQRILSDHEVLGMAWGGTVHSVIRSLNPCQKKNIDVVTMQGDICKCGSGYDVATLIKRAALTFSGNKFIIKDTGFLRDEEETRSKISGIYQAFFRDHFKNITVSIAGAGGWRPFISSPLCTEKSGYVRKDEQEILLEKGVVTDFILHMLDENGEEIDSPLKNRTVAIDLDLYKQIPKKIVLLSGENKAYTAKALLSGEYVDILFMDYQLAKKLYYLI